MHLPSNIIESIPVVECHIHESHLLSVFVFQLIRIRNSVSLFLRYGLWTSAVPDDKMDLLSKCFKRGVFGLGRYHDYVE